MSHGGPDNWSAGLVLYALMEGLAGVRDQDTAFRAVRLSPRWSASEARNVTVTTRYAASTGYVHYRFQHDPLQKRISINATGTAAKCQLRVLLPAGAQAVDEASIDSKAATAGIDRVGDSTYAVFPCLLGVAGNSRFEISLTGRFYVKQDTILRSEA